MMNLSAVATYGVRLMPRRSAWLESLGFFVFGCGLFLGLALVSFHTGDYVGRHLNPVAIANLAGPVGAFLAGRFYASFGYIAFVWPIVLILWGALMALGFVLLPRAQRFIALLCLVVLASAFANVQLGHMHLVEPVFGFGGRIGHGIGAPMSRCFGYGGALISLGVLSVVSLVLTGNLALSRTAYAVEYAVFYLRRGAGRIWRLYAPRKSARGNLAAVATRSNEPRPLLANEASQVSGDAKPSEARASSGKASEAREGKANDARSSQSGESLGALTAADYGIDISTPVPGHAKPEPSLFKRSAPAPQRGDDWKVAAERLTAQLGQFKIEGKVKAVTEGPVVTTFEFEPSPGTKVAKISSLAEDLARLLKAKSLRVLAPIPGKDTVGFEVPNAERRTIGFADLIDDQNFRSQKHALPIAMGVDIFGKPIVEDLATMPHLLVAGATGSGKSVFMNTLIASLICRHSANSLRFVMIDPKMVEMAAYNSLPHMACPVITDAGEEARAKLEGLVVEMEERYQRMRDLGAKNLQAFNEIIRNRRRSEFPRYEGKWQTMPYVVLIIDELADMMMVLGKAAETPITRLAQKARAAGIHLVLATQRPSADVVTGLIKANFPTRVAFRVLSGVDSRTILDTSGAEGLLGMGDMLFLAAGGMRRLHGAYLSDKEVANMVKVTGMGRK